MEEERRKHDDDDDELYITAGSSSPSRSLQISPPPSAALNGGVNYILHTVSKLDTLAGVAIKYGVEVSDIKRLNGLVTDLQMFALKTVRIPLPGRHPPSPSLCNIHDSSQRPSSSEPTRRHSDLFDSFQSLKLNSGLVPPASSRSLKGYYDGLRQTYKEDVYRNGGGAPFVEGSSFSAISSSPRSLNHHRKSKSVANGFMLENGGAGGGRLDSPLLAKNTISSDKWMAKLFRRRQKSETMNLLGDSDDDNSSFIRKSSSTSSLPEDSSAISSIWPNTSKWNLKPDFQALSSAAIPKPIMGWINKSALD